MAHPKASPDEFEVPASSDDCPACNTPYLRKLGDARACAICGYYRPPPAPDADILGILGRGDYKRLRGRLRHYVRRLSVGVVVGQVNSREIVRALARDLGVNHGTVLEPHKVIDEATHLIFLGYFAPEYRTRVLVQDKPLRIIIRGRWMPPPGGWPKRTEEPEETLPEVEIHDPEGSPFEDVPRVWKIGDVGGH